jgi:SNF2 family DNA or RNA helicase
VARSGRFEWITIPRQANTDPAGNNTKSAAAAPAVMCPECGWLDSVERFETLSGEPGVRECRRCGMRWDLIHEVNLFLNNENITLPEVRLVRNCIDIKRFYRGNASHPQLLERYLRAQRSALQKGFEHLVCLNTACNIEHLEHQIKTAFTVLKKMRGRALLADEVGLGKTIEAGILVKELLIRRLVKHVLIMVPAGLCRQWQNEFKHKFDENFLLFSDEALGGNQHKLIVSYDLAKRRPCLLNRPWDMLVLDEAHRLKNRSTTLYKFVKKLRRRYILALSATPIQNTLDELFSIVDLIQPGRLGTIRSFKRKFVSQGNPRAIADGTETELKEALADVMIRNRRGTCSLKFPHRRVGIYHITPSAAERALYESVSSYVHTEYKNEFLRETGMTTHLLSLITLQRELMSTPQAVRRTLIRIARRPNYPAATVSRLLNYADLAASITMPAKFRTLDLILSQYRGAKFVIFSEFLTSVDCLTGFISGTGRPVFRLTGHVNPAQRSEILSGFRRTNSAALVSTEVGGVGLNLQCCRCMINFDLPWNPQRIEQRIGRIDRFGQPDDEVVIFNLACRDTIEEYLVDILAKKLRMFELVIGELNEILGHMPSGRSFEQRIANILLSNLSRRSLDFAFGKLSGDVSYARSRYDRNQRFKSIVNQLGAEA